MDQFYMYLHTVTTAPGVLEHCVVNLRKTLYLHCLDMGPIYFSGKRD